MTAPAPAPAPALPGAASEPDGGAREPKTLRQLTNEFQRQVVAEAIERAPSLSAAARELGITRECLYNHRKRWGLHVGDPKGKAIPEDWRERLEATGR